MSFEKWSVFFNKSKQGTTTRSTIEPNIIKFCDELSVHSTNPQQTPIDKSENCSNNFH